MLPVAVVAQPLPQLYRLALAVDPAVAGAQAQVRAAEQRVVQARAAFGPTVALTGTKSRGNYREAPEYDERNLESKQYGAQLTQPLKRDALYPSLAQAHAQLEQAQAQLQQAETDAMQRLVEACFGVLKARDEVVFLQAQRVATSEQLASAQRSFQVGTVSVTDVREAQAKADTVAAQLVAASYELDLRQQIVDELVGQRVDGLVERGLTGERLPAVEPLSLPAWIADAQAYNAQLEAARQALEAGDAEVRKAWYGHAPTADLNYSYMRNKDNGSPTTLFGRKGHHTQVSVNVNIPLFASFATHAKVREAAALRDKARSDVDAARRQLGLDLREAFSATLSAASQARGFEAAVQSNETAVRANRRGYAVGMRVNSEVLEAQTRLFEARRDLSRARYDAWTQYLKLKAMAGRLSEIDLAELDGLLVVVPLLTPPDAPVRAKEGRQ
ncbi:TolC family outer membrane protein [Caldimonas brevitalea]|uniref:TolC family outer membrane protein n=1 Tax=Caldimonas brevitalea TaxID=413882 RepID=UPI001EED5D55|nr:TolC family outer membrane protein [Caldimonas brevitalea]